MTFYNRYEFFTAINFHACCDTRNHIHNFISFQSNNDLLSDSREGQKICKKNQNEESIAQNLKIYFR
jgi:hypothetical protein